jgi:hypothetical protein
MTEFDPVTSLADMRERRPPAREAVRDRLLEQAHLFEDPATYRSGVVDAFAALEAIEER